MWPGFGENMRVLQWIVERTRGRAKDAVASPFGLMPRHEDLNWQGIDYDKADFHYLMEVDRAAGLAEAEDQLLLFAKFKDRLPGEMERQRVALVERLKAAPEVWKLHS
jgi:phosphoenolpyruvate carboxykinase (GTP)